MERSKNKSEDESRDAITPNRVTKVHGGELVEAIAPEELVLVNEPECKHEQLVRDPTETDFNGFVCANPKCGVVVLFDKN